MTEEKEAAIIRRVFTGPYSHAENVLLRFRTLKQEMSHHEAIDVLHAEVVENQDS